MKKIAFSFSSDVWAMSRCLQKNTQWKDAHNQFNAININLHKFNKKLLEFW